MAEVPREAVPAAVQASFALPVGGGFLHASAKLPTGRTTLTELLPVIQQLDNAIVGRVGEEAERAGMPISCRAGCGACCRQLVPVSLFEAEALAKWMRALPEERRATLEERFHMALSMLRDAGVIDRILDAEPSLEKERARELAIEYFYAGVPCPFLEEESCSIHPIRPLACREYLVTSPPELCKDPATHDVGGVQLPLKLSNVLFSFGQQIEQSERGWIPLVFLVAWGKGEAAPGDFIAGSGEEVLKIFLQRAGEISEAKQE